MKKSLFILLFTLFFSSSIFAVQTVSISIVPQMQTTLIQKNWGAFLAELSKNTGIDFKIKYYATIPLFEDGLEHGETDIAFMNPYHAVMAYNWQKYMPIIHDKKSLVGILVVKKDGAIKTIADLNGKSLAFPAPNAFAASLLMRATLIEDKKINFKPIYVKTHSNVYRDVMFGLYPAGGGVNNTLSRENTGVQSQLKILFTTEASAPHPICVHPRIDKKTVQIIKDAILKMGMDPKYKDIMNEIQIPDPVSADYQRDYLPLKKLKLEQYVVNE